MWTSVLAGFLSTHVISIASWHSRCPHWSLYSLCAIVEEKSFTKFSVRRLLLCLTEAPFWPGPPSSPSAPVCPGGPVPPGPPVPPLSPGRPCSAVLPGVRLVHEVGTEGEEGLTYGSTVVSGGADWSTGTCISIISLHTRVSSVSLRALSTLHQVHERERVKHLFRFHFCIRAQRVG